METNQTTMQGKPAQTIASTTQPELPYAPNEAAQIANILIPLFNPEYILLFGRLAGGTPHSDATAYDLLVVVREKSEYDWMQAKRILRYKLPYRQRRIIYINPYILPLSLAEASRAPFIYFARAEGVLLYCSDSYRFRRPKRRIDFAAAHADAKFHFDTFRVLANELIEQAHQLFFRRAQQTSGGDFRGAGPGLLLP